MPELSRELHRLIGRPREPGLLEDRVTLDQPAFDFGSLPALGTAQGILQRVDGRAELGPDHGRLRRAAFRQRHQALAQRIESAPGRGDDGIHRHITQQFTEPRAVDVDPFALGRVAHGQGDDDRPAELDELL